MIRTPFSELAGTLLTMRRIPQDIAEKHGCGRMANPVGIYRGKKLAACVEFDDLFDKDGNRFYDD